MKGRELKETPAAMVEGGQTNFGVFRTPFRKINLVDAEVPGIPRAARTFRLKEWSHVGIVHPDAYFGLLINDSKYLGMSFFHMYDRRSGKFFEHEKMTPFAAGAKLSRELWNGTSYFRAPGHRVENRNRLEDGRIEFDFDIAGNKKGPACRGSITITEDLSVMQPLIVSLPLGENRSMYSHKAVLPASGRLEIGGEVFELDPARDAGILDVHKAYYPFRTWWKWCTFAGRDSKGRLIGINLTRNILKGDPDVDNENGFWADGRLSLLAAAEFEFDEKRLLDPWRIRTADGRVDLKFTPRGERKGKIDAGLIMSDFHQPFGVFSGFAVDDAGEKHEISDYFGIAEHHVTRW